MSDLRRERPPLRTADSDYVEQVVSTMGGTYNVGLPIIKAAAASSVMVAVENTATILNTLPSIARQAKKKGEASIVVEMNYRLSILGPCLGAVLMTAFCAESFIRLGFYVALERQRTRAARREAIERIRDGTITGYVYDPARASLVRSNT